MPRLPRISGARAVATLERLGFARVRSRGSHVVMAKSTPAGKRITCVVPLHDELAIGTLRGILRQAELSPEEFINKL